MRTLAVLTSTLLLSGLVFAQGDAPILPPEFYDGWRRIEGDRITFCVDPSSASYEFDKAVAEAIANVLLLNHSFVEFSATYAITAEGFMEDLFVLLHDRCDAFMGFSQTTGVLPDWLTITRPYVTFSYVIVTTDPGIETLLNLPVDTLIGAQMVSAGDRELIAFLQARPIEARWKRIPYGDNELMLTRLKDGTLGAALIWGPSLFQLTGGDPVSEGLHIIDPAPLHNLAVPVGMVLRRQEAFVREQIDRAVGALVADGTIASLLEANSMTGTPGGLDDR